MSLLRTLIQNLLDYMAAPPPSGHAAIVAASAAQSANTIAILEELQNVGDAVGTGGGTNSNVLIDCGTYLAPSENVLIDCGTYL